MKIILIIGLIMSMSYIMNAQSQKEPNKKEHEKQKPSKQSKMKAEKKTSEKEKQKPKEGKKIAIDQEGVSEDHLKKKKEPVKK